MKKITKVCLALVLAGGCTAVVCTLLSKKKKHSDDMLTDDYDDLCCDDYGDRHNCSCSKSSWCGAESEGEAIEPASVADESTENTSSEE